MDLRVISFFNTNFDTIFNYYFLLFLNYIKYYFQVVFLNTIFKYFINLF